MSAASGTRGGSTHRISRGRRGGHHTPHIEAFGSTLEAVVSVGEQPAAGCDRILHIESTPA